MAPADISDDMNPPYRIVKTFRIGPGARLAHANLSNARLWMAVLTNADLFHADLRNTNLSYADLTGANLQGANLTGSHLYQTNLTGCDLRGAVLINTELTWASLTGVVYDSDTVWPDGFRPPAASSPQTHDPSVDANRSPLVRTS